MYCLLHPHDRELCTHDPQSGAEGNLSHLCGVSFPQHYVCVNPYHLHKDPPDVNEDRKGCRYGNAFQCPHLPRCHFTNPETGLYRPCVSNDNAPPLNCREVHDGSCYDAGPAIRGDLKDFNPPSSAITSGGGNQSTTPEPTSSEAESIAEEARQLGELGLEPRRSMDWASR